MRARKALALGRVPVLVARVLAGERRQRVEDATGAVGVQWADPELLRAARDAHVEQPPADPRGVQQLHLARGAEHALLSRREVEREQAALVGGRQVVDDDVLRERGPTEAPGSPCAADDRRAGRLGEREPADLLGAVGQAHAVDEPGVGDGELHDSGNGLLEDRRERGAVGDSDRVAGAPGDLRAAERGVASWKLHLLAVAEQEAAEAGLLPDEVVARDARIAAGGRDRRGRARVSRDERERQRRGREHAQGALALRPLGERLLVTTARDEHEHRKCAPRREAQADHHSARNAGEPDAERQQRPARSRGNEGRHARPEEDAVEEERPRERHRPAPGLRDLKADLRPDAETGEVRDHGRGGECGRADQERSSRLDRRSECS